MKENTAGSNISIGVFDSGIGGLTVVKKLREKLPYVNIVYLGDTARVPYGTKSEETIIRFATEDTAFLIEKEVDLIVVACNTASSVALPHLRKAFKDYPIFGVVEPGVKMAIHATQSNSIGVIGTIATIKSHSHKKFLEREGITNIFEKACPLFVPLAEEGLSEGEIPELVARHYLEDIKDHIDTLILGCTHYPILIKTIKKVVGEKVKLIDPSSALAAKVSDFLMSKNIQPTEGNGKLDLYLTDIPPHYHSLLNLFLGFEPDTIEKVNLSEISSC